MPDIVTASYDIPQAVADDVEVFAIGDIHGRVDLLKALLDHAASLPRIAAKRVILQLGDLIDRGPDSLGTINLAMGMRTHARADDAHQLMGNHEQMAAVGMGDGNEAWRYDAMDLWRANGGYTMWKELLGEDDAPLAGRDAIKSSFGQTRLDFLRSMKTSWQSGNVIFVHAGISPNVKLDRFLGSAWDRPFLGLDEDRDPRWIRHPFLVSRHHNGAFVVHGHTLQDGLRRRGDATVSLARINLDLGSYETGLARVVRIVGSKLTTYDAIGDDVQRGLKTTKRRAGDLAEHIHRAVLEDR